MMKEVAMEIARLIAGFVFNSFLIAVALFLIRKYLSDIKFDLNKDLCSVRAGLREDLTDTRADLKDKINGNLRYVETKFEQVNDSVKREVEAIKDHCVTVQANCQAMMDKAHDERKKMWDDLYGHGHKGLDANGNKVTR